MKLKDASTAWLLNLTAILVEGDEVAPRGKLTKEIPQNTMVVDMRRPVLRVPDRKLSYQFMAAEAFWILSGDDTVAGIAKYNVAIAQFSDDGQKFFGAYGPKIKSQIGGVIDKLRQDRDTRQAGLTLWRENPPATKDVPCTIAMFFSIRDKKVNAHVFMRSSDAWLGVPYDVFNFSMVAHLICCELNAQAGSDELLSPGTLYLTAASSHLYEHNWAPAKDCVIAEVLNQPETPILLWNDTVGLYDTLAALRDTKPGHELRWWEQS